MKLEGLIRFPKGDRPPLLVSQQGGNIATPQQLAFVTAEGGEKPGVVHISYERAVNLGLAPLDEPRLEPVDMKTMADQVLREWNYSGGE